jgi:dTMP kinase
MGEGRFVVFEGIEGSGKSTQAKLLYEELTRRGRKCLLTSEPTDSMIGKLIRELLKSGNPVDIRTLQLLFIADRSEHLESLIRPKLEEGYIVITDRYAPSTIAYGTSFGKKYGLKMGYLLNSHRPFPAPDVLFYISVTPEAAFDRLKKRNGIKERFDELKSLRSLDRNYERLSKRYHPQAWRKIDGNREIDAIRADILAAWEGFAKG